MAADGLGIYFCGDTARWAVAGLSDGKPNIRARGTFPLEENGAGSLPEDLPDDIAVCLTPADSYLYKLTFPFSSPGKIKAVLKSDIEDRSLDPVDTVMADFYMVSAERDSASGFGVTVPRASIEKVLAVMGADRSPALVTLDVFPLLSLMALIPDGPDQYFLAGFAEGTGLMAEVQGGIIQQYRSIPAIVATSEEAVTAIKELSKRFSIENPEHGIRVFCADPALDARLREGDSFPYHLIALPGDSDAGPEDLIPAAAALAAVMPSRYPNFRQEDLSYGGVFTGLHRHAAILLSLVAVFLLTVIVGLKMVQSGYQQEITSIKARLQEDTKLIIGAKELEKTMKKPGMTLAKAVERIARAYRSRAGRGGTGMELPESAFKILTELFSYMPDELDLSWDRVIITEISISLSGSYKAEMEREYDAFVQEIMDSGRFDIRLNNTTSKHMFRLTLGLKKN